MMDAGHIEITFRQGTVQVSSSRARSIGDLFVNRSAAYVAETIPRLFSICGKAQAQASHMALAAAQGETVEVEIEMVVLAEAIREHLMRVAVDWRRALGEAPADATELRTIHSLPKLVAHDDIITVATHLLSTLVASPDDIRNSISNVLQQETIAPRLLRLVQSQGWQSLGCGATPDEKSAFTLCRDHPAVTALVAEFGDGLLARLYARLVHVALLIAALQDHSMKAELYQDEGWGEARVLTSRGVLTHHARMKDGIVKAYKIIAPTDVNFAVNGPAAMALHNLAQHAPRDIERPARLLTEAFDPCVAYALRVH